MTASPGEAAGDEEHGGEGDVAGARRDEHGVEEAGHVGPCVHAEGVAYGERHGDHGVADASAGDAGQDDGEARRSVAEALTRAAQ